MNGTDEYADDIVNITCGVAVKLPLYMTIVYETGTTPKGFEIYFNQVEAGMWCTSNFSFEKWDFNLASALLYYNKQIQKKKKCTVLYYYRKRKYCKVKL